jgi:U3 small nucleolar ribonucleoprotein protein LCP5
MWFYFISDALTLYMIALSHLMAHKLQGKPLEEAESMNMLLEQRVLIEKIRPMEAKLKYRIDKLLKQVDASEQGKGFTQIYSRRI